jgi:hypothetical protein
MEGTELRFDIYGRFVILLRDGGEGWWKAARVESDGKRRHLPEVLIPAESDPSQIVDYLEAVYHESARPGDVITQLES